MKMKGSKAKAGLQDTDKMMCSPEGGYRSGSETDLSHFKGVLTLIR